MLMHNALRTSPCIAIDEYAQVIHGYPHLWPQGPPALRTRLLNKAVMLVEQAARRLLGLFYQRTQHKFGEIQRTA